MAGKVKTRDRILQTALALFNNEGEAQVSTVDIASVMGISPGNLYYHFRGKEVIIEALFESFETELKQVLSAPIKKTLAIEENWIFVYIVFEEINDFRFFYYGLASILERCPELRPRMARLLLLKEKTVGAILKSLSDAGFIDCAEAERAALAERMAAHLTFWLQYTDLTDPQKSDKQRIHNGVYTTMIQIAPYVKHDRDAYVEMLKEFSARQK